MIEEIIEKLNNTVYAKLESSDIQGVGVFAIRDIPKGQEITDININNIRKAKPIVIKVEDFSKILPEVRELILDRMLFERGEYFTFFSPNVDACLRSFMNNAEDANSDGVVALRDIKKGEEITENYIEITNELHDLVLEHHKHLKHAR